MSCWPMNSVFGLASRSLCYFRSNCSVSPAPLEVPRALLEKPVELPVRSSSSGSIFLLGSLRLIFDSFYRPCAYRNLFSEASRSSIAFFKGAF